MAQLSLSFTISNLDSTIHLFSLRAPLTANALPSNVKFVQFDSKAGGQILYGDRQAIPELFTDLSPYQSYLNQWITSAAAASPALTLAQARAIKCAMVEAIYSVKRQMPVTVQITAGSHAWDVSDAAVARFIAPLSGLLYIDPLNAISATLETMRTALNTWASNIGTNQGATQSGLSSICTQVNAAINNARAQGLSGGGDAVSFDFAVASLSVTLSTTASNPLGAIPSQATAPTIQMVPFGETDLVTLPIADVQAIILAIAANNAKYQRINAQKQAAVNALSSIASVAAYDVTTGW